MQNHAKTVTQGFPPGMVRVATLETVSFRHVRRTLSEDQWDWVGKGSIHKVHLQL